jgi:hypothetical protein
VNYRYALPPRLSAQALSFAEFANGGAQCHVKLFDGTTHSGLLVSNATAIIAMRGEAALPFAVDLIDCLFQTTEDLHPAVRDGWQFFDEWTRT